MSVDREPQVVQAFVSLANSLVDGFDVIELLSGLTADCARLLDIASAGLLLADRRRVLHVLAASSEMTRNLELYQLQRDEGPCLDCYRDGTPVRVADLRAESERWPLFVRAATEAGFASVHAVPMRLHNNILGTLGLFGTQAGALADDDLHLAQALAHVASVALVHGNAIADATAISERLQGVLSSRVMLEQAKGVLAEYGNLDMDQAFAVLRQYSHLHQERLTDVAAAIVLRKLPPQGVLAVATSAT